MGRTESRYGTVEYQFSDYAGRSLAVFGPPIISGLPSVQYAYPLIMLPQALLGVSNALLAFRFAASSQYSRYWQGYPRRHRLPLNSGDPDERHIANDGAEPTENLGRSSQPDGTPPDADFGLIGRSG